MINNKTFIYHRLFVLLFEKKSVTNIDKEKKERYTYVNEKKEEEEEEEYNQHRDIQRQKKRKMKLWIILIPMMNLENKHIKNQKLIHTKTNKIKKKAIFNSQKNAHSFPLLNRANHRYDTVL
jgi:hypothetical protein